MEFLLAHLSHANITTSASSVARGTKWKAAADLNQARGWSELGLVSWKCPKWSHDLSPQIPSAMDTELAASLPNDPLFETWNPIPNSTITLHPHLFKIITPIKVNRFEQLLTLHPNHPLVKSICHGLDESFWPFANFDDSAPEMWDKSTCP